MDWNLAIEKNREALKRILAMLAAMVASAGGGRAQFTFFPPALPQDPGGSTRGQFTFYPRTGALPQDPALAEKSKLSPALTLPRHLHRFVLRLLRPAEAAARRLIIVAARGLTVELVPPRVRKPKPKSIFVRNGVGTGIVRQGSTPDRAPVPPRTLSLPLLDPLKRWGGRRRVKQRSVPRITFDFDRPREPDPPPPSPDDPLDAGRLNRRLEAIGRVLDDLPRQAKRLARWQARRDVALARERGEAGGACGDSLLFSASADLETSLPHGGKKADCPRPPRRLQRLSPMRPGRPPGWLRSPTHEVYEVLNELHGLAVWATARPDTS